MVPIASPDADQRLSVSGMHDLPHCKANAETPRASYLFAVRIKIVSPKRSRCLLRQRSRRASMAIPTHKLRPQFAADHMTNVIRVLGVPHVIVSSLRDTSIAASGVCVGCLL